MRPQFISLTFVAIFALSAAAQTVPPASQPVKSDASRNGSDDAVRDIETYKKTLKTKSPDELIGSFIPDSADRKFGEYDYYFNFMANIAIREELQSRGVDAKAALAKHTQDQTRIWEAVNGPGDTVGRICQQLPDAPAPSTQPAQ